MREQPTMNWHYGPIPHSRHIRHSYRMYFQSEGDYREVPWTDYYPATYIYATMSVRLCVNI